MKTAKNDGFVLVLVIVALSLTAVVMAVLTAGANTMLFHADRAHAQAVQRNLRTSGLAWARHRLADPNVAATGPVALETDALSARETILTVSFLTSDVGAGQIHIETACSKGRQTLKATESYPASPAH
jgi:hypothetical protein